jgi:PQQ-like domain
MNNHRPLLVLSPVKVCALGLLMLTLEAATLPAWGIPYSPGDRLWSSKYATKARFDYTTAIGVSPSGSLIFVTGFSDMGAVAGSWDYATAAYDAATGTRLWASRYDGPGRGVDQANDLGVSPDGTTVYVTGYSNGTTPYDYDFATIAYSASNGAVLWISRYETGYAAAHALAVSPDGSAVIVTGEGSGTGSDMTTIAYDAGTGQQLWLANYDGPAHNTDYATELEISSNGSMVVAAGTSWGGTSFDYATVAYDSVTGEEMWWAQYGGPGDGFDVPAAAGISRDGDTVLVTGYSQIGPGQYDPSDYLTLAYDAATGEEQWLARYDGSRGYNDGATALGVSPDSSMVFVTGFENTDAPFDYVTIAYERATGTEIWKATTGGPASDTPAALEVSPDGSAVFVTGRGQRANDGIDDFLTAAYDASTGQEVWLARDGGSGSDFATALAVSPGGSTIFVGGSVQVTPDYESDYLTIAYSS